MLIYMQIELKKVRFYKYDRKYKFNKSFSPLPALK